MREQDFGFQAARTTPIKESSKGRKNDASALGKIFIKVPLDNLARVVPKLGLEKADAAELMSLIRSMKG